MSCAPAEPSTALSAVHDNGVNIAPTRIVTLLVSVAPQMSAACWNAIRRCWPSVVPALPPTGATAAGSLKPSPAAFRLVMTMVAAAWAPPSAQQASATAAANRLASLMIVLLVGGGRRALERGAGGVFALHALHCQPAVRIAVHD